MAFDPTPWFIGGGAHHSPDIARALAYAATGGQEGVVAPADLKVTAFGSPGGSVNISSGAAVILNRSGGGDRQSYVMRAPTDTTIGVTPTGGSPRSDLVVVRVEDPQFPPWQAPNDPVTATYVAPFVVQNVPGGTTSAADLNLGYSAIALARIDMPAGTSSITSGMITDVRALGQARSAREVLVGDPGDATLTSTTFVDFPNYRPQLVVPTWATHAIILASITGLGIVGGDTTGAFRTQLGSLIGADQAFNFDGSTGDYRTSTLIVAQGDVRAMQGRTQTLVTSGRRQTGPGAPRSLGGTTTVFDVQFTEKTV